MDRLSAQEAEFLEEVRSLQEPERTLFLRYMGALLARQLRSEAQQAGNDVSPVVRLVKGAAHG
jgi:hypothetical protein